MARSGKIPGNLWHQKEFARSVPNGHGQPELIVVGSSISAEKSINAGCRCAAIWFGRLSKSGLPIPMLRLDVWGFALLISVPRRRPKCLVNGPAGILKFATMVIGAITGAINHPRCRLCAFPVHHRNQSGDAPGEAMAFLLAHI